MLEIEKYLIKQCELENLQADDKYLSDGIVVVSKKDIRLKILKDFKTMPDNTILKNVPFEKGKKWEIPNEVVLRGGGKFDFKYDDIFSFDYDYIKLFEQTFCCCSYFALPCLTYPNSTQAPVLKVFNFDKFVGLIVSSIRDYELFRKGNKNVR